MSKQAEHVTLNTTIEHNKDIGYSYNHYAHKYIKLTPKKSTLA